MVRICWVQGHSYHKSNEKADKLDRAASEDPDLRVFRARRGRTDGCSISKLFWLAVSEKKVKEVLGTTRQRTRTLIGVFTGKMLRS